MARRRAAPRRCHLALTATHITEALLQRGHVERHVDPLIDVHPVVKVLVLRIDLPRESGTSFNGPNGRERAFHGATWDL